MQDQKENDKEKKKSDVDKLVEAALFASGCS